MSPKRSGQFKVRSLYNLIYTHVNITYFLVSKWKKTEVECLIEARL